MIWDCGMRIADLKKTKWGMEKESWQLAAGRKKKADGRL
jgi:hypothetical protein